MALNSYRKSSFVREIVTILVVLVMMLPFYFLVNIALKSDQDALTTPPLEPANPTLQPLMTALSGDPSRNIPVGAVNSIIITGGSVLVLVVFGSIAAYAITRIPGKLSNTLYILFLAGIILPFQLGMVPLYVAMRSVGLVGSQVGMIVLYSGLLMPLAVFLYTGFTRSLPREYEEAAQLDGASRFQTFRRVIFPLLSPATGTVVIMTGIIVWNDFFTSLIFLSGTTNATLPVVVYGFVGAQVSTWNVIFAAVALSMIPILIFYLIAQKKFIQGFAGGIKA